MNLSNIYTTLIFLSLIIFVINLIYKRHSKLLYIICACVFIFGITIRYIQSDHGTNTIGGFFENQKEYEANYKIELAEDGSTNIKKNITAAIQRPEPTCGIFRIKCSRESLLVKAYTEPQAIEFFPSYCILNLNSRTLCLDNHAKSWNVNIISKIPK